MRLRQTRVKTYVFRRRIYDIDNEGTPDIKYIDSRVFKTPDGKSLIMPDGKRLCFLYDNSYTAKGYLWEHTSTREMLERGDRIENTASMRIEGEYRIEQENGVPKVIFADGRELRINDGVYIHADINGMPDYIITAITEHRPLKLEVERYG